MVDCGDDLRDDGNAVRLRELLHSFGFVEHVTEPTHARGHTLDLVITKSETAVLSLRVGGMISDHVLIRFVLPLKKHNGSPAERGADYHVMLLRRIWRRPNCVQT